MKYNNASFKVAMALILAGVVSIPVTYKYFSMLGLNPLLPTVLIAMTLIGGGLFLIYIHNEIFKIYSVDKIDTDPNKKAVVKKQIIITINDDRISLITEGISPREAIGFLETSKFYIIDKTLNTGPVIDTVKRT